MPPSLLECARARARATLGALLALKIRATDICPGKAEARARMSRLAQKSHGRKLDS